MLGRGIEFCPESGTLLGTIPRTATLFLDMHLGIALLLAVLAIVFAALGVRLYLLLRKVTAERDELAVASQDMEAATKAKGEFLASMSHEIRTPLNALTSFSEILIQRSIQGGNTTFQEENGSIIDIIKQSSVDILNIINSVIDYVKMDANLLEIESVPMSIKQVIHDVCHAEKPNVIAKHLDLSIKYSGDIPPTILSDPLRIRQILSNLVSNAVKFTEKGTISVLCEAIDSSSPITAKDDANAETKDGTHKTHRPSLPSSLRQLKISVIDTGIGISASAIPDLFKPFKRDHSSSSKVQLGTGLGLNIVHRLATLMDATINVESIPGQGSIFSLLMNVFIPDEESQELRPSEPAPQTGSQLREGLDIRMLKTTEAGPVDKDRPLQKMRILVVEDMAVNQVIVATLLRSAGAKVELADNGAMGVQRIMQDMDNGLVFDVILMDMQMPVMDGYEATAYLRKYGYQRPIIAVTAHALTGDREKTIKAGCDDYIAKPIDNQALIDMIKKHVGVE